jgi:hypothetical protein
LRGKFTPGYFPDITLDGKARQLSPAARIFNQDNRIEMPAAVRGKDLVVNYRGQHGQYRPHLDPHRRRSGAESADG